MKISRIRGLLATILIAGVLSAPHLAAAKTVAIVRPTHLRPVQSKADCAAALSLLAVICGSGIQQGDLQLIWDESTKNVDGYRVYRVDGGGHQLLGSTAGRYYFVKKPREGYANLCFAAEAYRGERNSKDSARYCYAPGATATTRTFSANRSVSQISWNTPNLSCTGQTLSTSAFIQAVDNFVGSAFTTFFPFLPNESSRQGSVGVGGLYAGDEAVVAKAKVSSGWQLEPLGIQGPETCQSHTVRATIGALAGTAFDLGRLRNHKIYSATLFLKQKQTVTITSGKAQLSSGRWCWIWLGVANRQWWLSPLGNLTYNTRGRVQILNQPPPTGIDVTKQVSAWGSVKYANNYGFIIASTLPKGAVPFVSNACMTNYANPSMKVVYF